jgi:Co/Zn/Cd efflux system component
LDSIIQGCELGCDWTLGVWLNGLLFFFNVQPQAEIMGSIGALALVANFLSVAILLKYRDCDSNVRSVWLFSRNDVLAAKKIVYPLELPQIEACVNL